MRYIPTVGRGAYEWPISEALERRFWAKVDRRGADECWPWLACVNHSGYGMIRNGNNMALAHRVAWVIENGEVARRKHVLHTCDNPACCNPAHLYVGTNADNIADKIKRGRSSFPHPERRGEKHPLAKLKQEEVDEIRALRGHVTGRELARRFGVTPSNICNIQKGKIW